MSMPGKGKHHLQGHHQPQQHALHHPQQLPPQYVGVPNQVHHSPVGYGVIASRTVAHGNEFHIPGQNYGGQGGNQVGGGGSNVGVPGGRGPAGLSGIQPLGQTTTGLGGGGPGGAGQQAPPQPPTQSLQQQGPNQTSTPPGVHTSTAPDMGKQPHLQQAQPNTLPPNSYGQAPTRPVAFYQSGPRPQQQQGLPHRRQGNAGTAVVNMPVGNGQQAGMYPHPHQNIATIPQMNVLLQQGLHPPQHQFGNPIQMQNVYHPQRHQQNPVYYPQIFLTPNQPHPQHYAYYSAHSPAMNLNRPNTSNVSAGTQHSGSPMVNAQASSITQQGPLPLPPAQTMPMQVVSQIGADIYMAHNGSMMNMHNNAPKNQNVKKESKALKIINPVTLEQVVVDEKEKNSAAQGDGNVSQTSQLENGAEVRAEFAARVAKTLEEPSKESSKEKNEPKVVPAEESKIAPELAVEKPKEDEKKESAKAQSPPRRKSPERKKDDEKKREDKPIAAPKIEATAKPANGEADKDAPESCKADGAQKNADGKAAQQKQKNKSKVNRRDLNRRGAEKEGTDMDAFMNAVPTGAKNEAADAKPPSVPAKEPSPGQAEEPATLPKEPASAAPPASTIAVEKGLKDRDNHNESKKDKPVELTEEPVAETDVLEKTVKNEVPDDKTEENKKVDDEVDHAAVSETTVSSSVELKSIVEMKNKENAKISERTSAVDESSAVINEPELPPTTQEEPEPKPVEEPKAQAPPKPTLKYKYTPEMWSPVNQSGQRIYNREFLMNLQSDPQSQRKPTKLPELDVVLKDNKSQSSIGNMRMSNSMGGPRSDSFFPFGNSSNDRHKSNVMQKTNMPPSKNSSLMRDKNSRGNKPGAKPPMTLSISLKEDVKLKETANAWKPNRMKSTNVTDEEVKSDRLYKKVRSVLNKLTPDNLKILVKQVAGLEIDSRERLDGVIKLVFEKAIEEPNFSETYAQFCKEVGSMQVNLQDSQESNAASFKRLIINRCQVMFESHATEENVTTQEIQKELSECKDPEKKKELQIKLEDEKRRIRIKSVGNIRFIGEIFKLGMLTIKIMLMCIQHLLDNPNEENLECLCKLLTTIGETLEMKNKQDLSQYFDRMTKISQQKTGKNKISSRIRFMLQDVIELRNRKWVPRRENSNPKTMGEIKQDFINEKKINVFSSLPATTPRKDDRGDRKRNRPGQCDDGWIQTANRTSRQPLNVEPSRLKNKPPSMDDLQLGDRNMYLSMSNKNIQSSGSKLMTTTTNKFQLLDNYQSEDKRIAHTLAGSRSTGPQYRSDYGSKSSYDRSNTRNGSHQMNSGSSSRENNAVYDSTRSQSMTMPPPSMKLTPQTTSAPKAELTPDEISKLVSDVVKKYKSHDDYDEVKAKITEKISDSSATAFVTELVNSSLEKTAPIRTLISTLMCSLMTSGCINLAHYKAGFLDILSMTEDLEIDIPKVLNYLVEILVHPIAKGIFPLSDLKSFLSPLRESKYCGKFVGLLLKEIANEKSPQWVHEKWSQSGLQLSELVGPSVKDINAFVSEYNLGFITDGKCTSSSTGKQVNLDFVHSQLLKLMKETQMYDEIVSWITKNVGDNVKDPKFVRTLMTAILETSIEVTENKSDFLVDKFTELETLIQRFVDTDATLELQCVYAIQAYMYKLKYPQGLILKIFNKLLDDGVISSEAFLQWEKDDQPSEQEGKGMAVKFTTSFFTALKEIEDDDASDAEDEASEDEAPKDGSEKDQTSSEQLSAHPSSLSQDCRG